MCEKEYAINHYSEEYHKRWNEASGKVAKLQRLGHVQAINLRARLSLILPLYDENMQNKLTHETKKLVTVPYPQNQRVGNIKRVNSLINKLGILTRTNRPLAKSLRLQINSTYLNKPTVKEIFDK